MQAPVSSRASQTFPSDPPAAASSSSFAFGVQPAASSFSQDAADDAAGQETMISVRQQPSGGVAATVWFGQLLIGMSLGPDERHRRSRMTHPSSPPRGGSAGEVSDLKSTETSGFPAVMPGPLGYSLQRRSVAVSAQPEAVSVRQVSLVGLQAFGSDSALQRSFSGDVARQRYRLVYRQQVRCTTSPLITRSALSTQTCSRNSQSEISRAAASVGAPARAARTARAAIAAEAAADGNVFRAWL